MLPSVLPSQYANLVQGQTARRRLFGSVCGRARSIFQLRYKDWTPQLSARRSNFNNSQWETRHVRGNAGADKYSPCVVGPAGREVPNDRITVTEGSAWSTSKEGTV